MPSSKGSKRKTPNDRTRARVRRIIDEVYGLVGVPLSDVDLLSEMYRGRGKRGLQNEGFLIWCMMRAHSRVQRKVGPICGVSGVASHKWHHVWSFEDRWWLAQYVYKQDLPKFAAAEWRLRWEADAAHWEMIDRARTAGVLQDSALATLYDLDLDGVRALRKPRLK